VTGASATVTLQGGQGTVTLQLQQSDGVWGVTGIRGVALSQ
jgi:hypothetical protein